jgi:SAM-dependent methyltransferase
MTTEDTIPQTNFLIDILSPKQGEVILDIGCGTGNEIKRICNVAKVKKVHGIDISEKALLKAEKNLSKEIKQGKVELLKAGASDKLPFPSKYFDAIFSAELIECLPKKKQNLFLKEMHRILKPGGRILTEHTDWDTQVWNASDKNLERKLVHAFCDTTQGWMESSEGWMGRKLWGFFNNSKLFKNCRMEVYVLTNTKYKAPFYGYQRSLDMSVTTKNKNYKITKKDVEKFLTDLKKRDKKGTYFYSVNRYIHIGYK